MPEEKNNDVSEFPTEDEVIPASVLETMKEVGIGDDSANETGDTETKVEDDTGDKQGGSDSSGEDDSTKTGGDTEEISDTEKPDEDVEGEEVKKEDETEPIPQDQINIARRRGWSDEKIVKIAEENPEILEDMVALAGQQTIQPQVETKVEPAPIEKQEAKGVDKVELDAEALKKMKDSYGDEVVDSVILPLMGGLNNTIDQLNSLRGTVSGVEQTNQATQAKKNFDEANTVFDGLTETFTVFGKTDELPRTANGSFDVNSSAVQARGEVFKVASAFAASGMSWTDSLKNSVRWYKGEHAEKSLERKIVKGLNSRKKKFSPRPTSKKTKQTFVSREEEGEALVRKILK